MRVSYCKILEKRSKQIVPSETASQETSFKCSYLKISTTVSILRTINNTPESYERATLVTLKDLVRGIKSLNYITHLICNWSTLGATGLPPKHRKPSQDLSPSFFRLKSTCFTPLLLQHYSQLMLGMWTMMLSQFQLNKASCSCKNFSNSSFISSSNSGSSST